MTDQSNATIFFHRNQCGFEYTQPIQGGGLIPKVDAIPVMPNYVTQQLQCWSSPWKPAEEMNPLDKYLNSVVCQLKGAVILSEARNVNSCFDKRTR